MSDATSPHSTESSTAPWNLRFGLRHLLALMAAVCLLAAAYRVIGWGAVLLAGLIAFVGALAVAISRGKWLEALTLFGFVVALFWLATPSLGPHVSAARRTVCQSNLKDIAIALQNYHDVYKRFPPAYIADESGKPMHSWRVLILPFLEQKALYDQIRFYEPWDSPHNSKLAAVSLELFRCPEDGKRGRGHTSYVAVVGPGTAWPGAKSIDIADINDGTSNTILVVEVKNSGIHWMEPRDLDASQMPMTINAKPVGASATLDISSGHKGVAQVAFADGSVRAIPEVTPAAMLRAMLTIAGGESVPPP
jgi:prepilin-type processing-associated H-X9-DG protein